MLYICLGVIVFIVGCDQLTKALFFEKSVDFINGFIRFEYSPNYGMAWGLLGDVPGATLILAIFSALFAGIMIFVMIRWRKLLSRLIMLSFSLVIAGAIGNLIDRMAMGYVRDFISTEFMRFPTFNLADSAITVGGILLAAAILFTKGGDRIVEALEFKKTKRANIEEELTNEPATPNNKLNETDSNDDGKRP